MDNATTQSKEALLEPVPPGSATFDENILAPLQSNYLNKESKECFTYKSAHFIKNAALQKRYAAFRTEKRDEGYSEQELEESYGFLLFDDLEKAEKVGKTGLFVGQAKCTTLGDSSKGVYISKYSDCLDLKRWYDGKTGYIVLVKLTKGKVKEVTDNYTQNFTPPTPGFDCHISEQLGAVTSTTSSFLAFERTQYYLYELAGSGGVELCPRQTCPLAIVTFCYGTTAANLRLENHSQDKRVFSYKPWIGQLKIESTVYDIGLQSVSGAWIPAKLPKMVKIDRAIGVSELKRTLPREIFETCLVGEVCIDGRSFNLYDVVSSKAKNDLAQITQELKEKDMALVIPLDDSGFLILLHSSHLFSYEDAKSGKAAVLQGMFIFPDTRTVPRDTKCALPKQSMSTDIIQAIPAINYAETEMEKCPPNQQGTLTSLEKHLQNYATLIQPGLIDAPTREASMFPDQYDVPSGFTLISPKWSQETGTRLKSYFEEPCGFTVPVVRALELLAAGRQQRGDEQDDDVFYYISSPEEVPPASAEGAMEVTEQAEAIREGQSTLAFPTENCVDGRKSQKCNETVNGLNSQETLLQTSNTQLTVSMEERDGVSDGSECIINPGKAMADNKVYWRSRPRRRGRKGKMHWKTLKKVQKELTLTASSLPQILPINSTESAMDKNEKPQSDYATPNDIKQRPHSSRRGRGHRRRGMNRKLSETSREQASSESTAVSTSMPAETLHNEDEKLDSRSTKDRDWRSLPRRKKSWNTDFNVKRCLRSNGINTDINDSLSEECFSRTPKRKMEGFSLKDRYGLRNIITTCGRVFVPHGSESGDVDSSNMCHETNSDTKVDIISPMENKFTKIVESSEVSLFEDPVVSKGQVSSKSPSKDKPWVQPVTPIKTVSKHNNCIPSEIDKNQQPTKSMSNEVESLPYNIENHLITSLANETTSPLRVPDQSMSTLPKVASPEKTKKKDKRPVYSAISISKLKTVLRRGKRPHSPSSGGDGKSEPEPKTKKVKSENTICNFSRKQPKGKGSQTVCDEEKQPVLLYGSQEPMSTLPVSGKGLIPQASKENEPHSFHASDNFKIIKQADEQLMSSLIGERVGSLSSDGKGSTEKLGATLPSDALSLLADLALGTSNNKMLTDIEVKTSRETPTGVLSGCSPDSVLHALLQRQSTRFNLPPRSPFPEGVIVTGELLLEISKEHSYSQPTSLMSGLSGISPQVFIPHVESPLTLMSGLHLNLPMDAAIPFCQKGVKTQWKMGSSNEALPSNSKTKIRRSKIFQNRHVLEKKGSIVVKRIWRETYEFKFDSKFTNNSLDKTVIRALHGKWNFDIEDSPEEVHLIFHMWIGLFYSKSTSRLFHLENCLAMENGKDMDIEDKQCVDTMQAMSSINVKLNLKEDSPKALHPHLEILDLSVKNSEPVSLHPSLQQSKDDDLVSHREISSNGIEAKHLSSGPSSPLVTALMHHRSAVDILSENMVSDKDDDVDDENDIIADCSYTQLLEGNSAYSRLCEQTSNMRIGMRHQMKEQKMAVIDKNVAPIGKTHFSPKDIVVFHQVIKPPAFSRCSGLVMGKFRTFFDKNLKDKTENANALQKKTDMSKNAFIKAHEGGLADENVVKTLELKNGDVSAASGQKESVSKTKSSNEVSQADEDHHDEGLTVAKDFEENVTAKSLSGDVSSVTEHNKTFHENIHNHTNKCDNHVDDLTDKLLTSETKSEDSLQLEALNAKEDDSNIVNSSVEVNKIEEPVEEADDGCSVQEKMEEITEQDNGSDLDLDQMDNTDNIDMEISDNYSSDNSTMDAYEANSPNVETFVSETLNSAYITEEHNVKREQSQIQTEQPVEESPGVVACKDIDNVSKSGDVSSQACQLMSVEVKTISACENSTVEVVQSLSKNKTIEQNIQQDVLYLCENEPQLKQNVESSKLEESQEPQERDDNDNKNDNETQLSLSCEDKTQGTHQKSQSPHMSTSSTKSTANFYKQPLAPQALNKASVGESTSTCSTPTQDEVLYDPEISENVIEVPDSIEASNRDLHCTDSIDHDITKRSYVSQQVDSKTSFSDFVKPCEETTFEEPGSSKSNYTCTMDSMVKNMSPREMPDIQFKQELFPTSQQKDKQITNTDSASQHDSECSYYDVDVDETRRFYHSDEHLQLSYCKTDQSDGHPFDEGYEDYSDASYSVYNTGVSDDSYEPKFTGIDNFSWAKKKAISESFSDLNDANRRGDHFRCQTKVNYSPTDNVEQIQEKRSRTEWNEEDLLSCTVDCSIRKTSHHTTRTVKVNSLSHSRRSKQRFDWRRYFKREATWYDSVTEGQKKFDVPPSSLVTVLDKKGHRVTFDNSPAMKRPLDTNRMTMRSEDSPKHRQDHQNKVDLIQSAVDLEYLIFSEQINRIVKDCKSCVRSFRHRSVTEHTESFPATSRFSNEVTSEVGNSDEVERLSLSEFTIKVDLSDRKRLKRKRKRNCYETASEKSEHNSRMNDIWTDRTVLRQNEGIKRQLDKDWRLSPSGSVTKDAFDNLHDNISFTVKQECSLKYRFYILVTSEETFFDETRNLLMMEGHLPVKADEFDLNGSNQTPLLIVLRNEDIAEHISELPYLLDLKKSSNVLFAGIDRPDDVVNFTHQEIFANGGFIVFDELALGTLTLDNMRKVVGILEELDKKGKWKWFLHYKDSRTLRESSRSGQEASKKQRFIDFCQEAGIVEILPYHDCDVPTRGQPDYLFCLNRLQIENTSVRFPVFITDTSSDAFEKNGILTMDIFTFSQILSKDSCYVS